MCVWAGYRKKKKKERSCCKKDFNILPCRVSIFLKLDLRMNDVRLLILAGEEEEENDMGGEK